MSAPKRPALQSCSSCGGVWADNATAKEIVERLDMEIARLAHETAARGPKPIAPRRLERWDRKCPECSEALARVEQASTSLDVCTAHGTFFDRDELAQVIETLRRERGFDGKASRPAVDVDVDIDSDAERRFFAASNQTSARSRARESPSIDAAGAVFLGLDLLSDLFD